MIFYAIYGDDNTAYLKLYDSEAALNVDIDHQFHSSNSTKEKIQFHPHDHMDMSCYEPRG